MSYHFEYSPIDLPCGAVAEFDFGSGIGYRCTSCNAVVGSIGMPRGCYDLMRNEEEKEQVWEAISK